LGFIDKNYQITNVGKYANKIRFIDLGLRKMILTGYYTDSSILDLVTIAAFVYTGKRNIFSKEFQMWDLVKSNNYEFYNKIVIADDFINCIFIWNAFKKFIEKKHKIDEIE